MTQSHHTASRVLIHIGLINGLSPNRRENFALTNADTAVISPTGTNFKFYSKFKYFIQGTAFEDVDTLSQSVITTVRGYSLYKVSKSKKFRKIHIGVITCEACVVMTQL